MSKHTIETRTGCMSYSCLIDGVDVEDIDDIAELKACAHAIVETFSRNHLNNFLLEEANYWGETVESKICECCGDTYRKTVLELDY